MRTTRFIGDVHGKFKQYKQLLKDSPPSIQVGDLGLGFRHITGAKYGEFTQNPPHAIMKAGNHRFIRGNHDNPIECTKNSQWIKDGTIEDGVMFIGGTSSIDKDQRVKDFTWWEEEEELSYKDLDAIVANYLEAKPHTVVSHDCPQEVASILYNHTCFEPTRTQQALQQMLNGHSPDLWLFGHHHIHCWIDVEKAKKNTKFICLAELEALDIDLNL